MPDPPSQFVREWLRRAAGSYPGRALDVAMGTGRHAQLIAAAGFRTFGVDIDLKSAATAVKGAAENGAVIRAWCADLTTFQLPTEHFDLIVVVRYLQRDLFSALIVALAHGGVILYETFTEAQRGRGRGPTSPDHLLKAGELRERFSALDVLFYEETFEPDALARLAARKR